LSARTWSTTRHMRCADPSMSCDGGKPPVVTEDQARPTLGSFKVVWKVIRGETDDAEAVQILRRLGADEQSHARVLRRINLLGQIVSHA
jgi:hypothetical protein